LSKVNAVTASSSARTGTVKAALSAAAANVTLWIIWHPPNLCVPAFGSQGAVTAVLFFAAAIRGLLPAEWLLSTYAAAGGMQDRLAEK
jgi:hypothetical protein